MLFLPVLRLLILAYFDLPEIFSDWSSEETACRTSGSFSWLMLTFWAESMTADCICLMREGYETTLFVLDTGWKGFLWRI